MKEYHLICCGCKTPYISKYWPRNNVWYCTKSCANHYNHRRHMEGKCHTCKCPISSSRKYCKKCLVEFRNSQKNETKKHKKEYLRQAVKSYVRKIKEMAIQYKGGKCIFCGYDKYNGSLQFHHVFEENKSFSISGKSISFNRIKPELEKCVLVCANCHGEIHGGIISKELLLKKFGATGGIRTHEDVVTPTA